MPIFVVPISAANRINRPVISAANGSEVVTARMVGKDCKIVFKSDDDEISASQQITSKAEVGQQISQLLQNAVRTDQNHLAVK